MNKYDCSHILSICHPTFQNYLGLLLIFYCHRSWWHLWSVSVLLLNYFVTLSLQTLGFLEIEGNPFVGEIWGPLLSTDALGAWQILSDQKWTQASAGFSRHWMIQANLSHLCTGIAHWGMMITLHLSHADKMFNPFWQQIQTIYLQPISPHCLDLKRKVNILIWDLKHF